MVKVILVLCFIFSFSSFGKNFHIVRLKNNIFHANHEHSVVLKKNEIKTVRNTNALCAPEEEALIGEFIKNTTKLEKANYFLVKEISKRMNKDGSEISLAGRRDARYFMDGIDITGEMSKKKLIKSILERTCDLSDWTKVQTAKGRIIRIKQMLFLDVEITKNGKNTKKRTPLYSSGCKKSGRIKSNNKIIYDCPVSSFGSLRIISAT